MSEQPAATRYAILTFFCLANDVKLEMGNRGLYWHFDIKSVPSKLAKVQNIHDAKSFSNPKLGSLCGISWPSVKKNKTGVPVRISFLSVPVRPKHIAK